MKKIPLSKYGENRGKYFALVDDSDYDYLMQWNWSVDKSGYNIYASRNDFTTGKKVHVKMHRQIMNTPPGMDCDHKDLDTLNNQRGNLRNCTRSQNAINSRVQANSTTKLIGVHRHISKHVLKTGDIVLSPEKYMAKISLNNKRVYIGVFDTPEQAALAYNQKAIELHGEYARLNQIPA